jgi:phosphatidylglycerol:prolipoprotein diacylglycerol transferase
VQKVAFHLGPLAIHWYGILVMLGFVLGLWTAGRRAPRHGVTPQQVWDAGTWLIIGVILGARTLYVISYWKEEFAGEPWTEIFMVHHGGLVFYGGFIGAAVAVILYTGRNKTPLWKFADVLAPSIALGYVLGRLGCLMNGCCYGSACDLPWAIHFPADHETRGAGVHPTQIYDALLNGGLFLALEWFYRRKTFDGQIFAAWLMAYAALRSAVEIFRGDYPQRYLGGLFTPAQVLSVAILVAGGVLYLTRQKAVRKAA